MEVTTGYKQTEVGVIPEDWDWCGLCEVARLESGHTLRRTIARLLATVRSRGCHCTHGFT